MTKSEQIAAALNQHTSVRPYDYRGIAEATAASIGVDLYWAGTACLYSRKAQAEVWQHLKSGAWGRRLGCVVLGDDGVWRA